MSPSASNDVQIDKLIENLSSEDSAIREAAIENLRRLEKALEDKKQLRDTFLQELDRLRDFLKLSSKPQAVTPWLLSTKPDYFWHWLTQVEEERKRLASNPVAWFEKSPIKVMLSDTSSASEKKEIEISSDFLALLVNLSQRTNSSESEIIKKGLILVGLTEKVKEEGLGLAVVDNNNSVVTSIEDF